jgi:hypothetical protein
VEILQLAIADSSFAGALREMLVRNAAWKVLTVDVPDPLQEGVIVMDAQALERLGGPLSKPERVVLFTRNDPSQLARAWDAGVVSVVFENDPISTAMLAIMAARLRIAKPAGQPAAHRAAGGDRGQSLQK